MSTWLWWPVSRRSQPSSAAVRLRSSALSKSSAWPTTTRSTTTRLRPPAADSSRSSSFARPDRGHVISPFYRCGGLKLHAVEEMQQRYDEFAAGEYDRVYGGQRGGHVGEDGVVHTDPVPENPYKAKVSAR